jgi:hypothetical protein
MFTIIHHLQEHTLGRNKQLEVNRNKSVNVGVQKDKKQEE